MIRTPAQEMNHGVPMYRIVGCIPTSYPSRGAKNLKTTGLEKAIKTEAAVCIPGVS